MAQIDLLTNGTIEIDLASNLIDAFAQISGGYNQKIVELDELGRYPLVWEEWPLNWAAANDNDRGDMHAELMELKRLARKWANGDWEEPPVWRIMKTPGETGTRFAFVHDLQIPELSPQFYEPNQSHKGVLIRVLREGVFRPDDPESNVVVGGSDGSLWQDQAAETVYNYDDGTNHNYLTYNPTEAGTNFDAEALTKIAIDYGTFSATKHSNLIVARKSGTTTELDKFTAFFNGNTASAFADAPLLASPVADANIAGGTRIDFSNGSGVYKDTYLQWAVPDMVAYSGNFLVYAQMLVSVNPGLDIQFGQGFGALSGTYSYIDTVDISDITVGMSWRYVYLGLATIPAYGKIPRGQSVAASYNMRVRVGLPDTGAYSFGSMFLVPVDEGVFGVNNISDAGSAEGLVINGDLLRTYTTNSGGDITGIAANPNGRYLTAAFDQHTRYYFYQSGLPIAGYDESFYGLYSTEITRSIIARLKALRLT